MGNFTPNDLGVMVESELRDVLQNHQAPLNEMVSHHLGGRAASRVSARKHGAACLTACLVAGGDPRAALPAAAAVELVNGLGQVHDDLQKENPTRDDRASVWQVWGPAQAINVGDAMHAMGRLSIYRMQDKGASHGDAFRAVQLLDDACLKTCEGRFQDLIAQEWLGRGVEGYLKVAESKTGALYACAMELGALAATAPDEVQGSLGRCGANLGVASQITDDMRAIWPDGGGEPAPSRRTPIGKGNLPLVRAWEVADAGGKRTLDGIDTSGVPGPEEAESLRRILEETGARSYCQGLVSRYREEAEAAIESCGLTGNGSTAISQLSQLVLGR